MNTKATKAPKIVMVAGSKGGVGKSMVSMALLDYLAQEKQDALLVETDTSNPDVAKAYQGDVLTAPLNLDVPRGWTEMVNTIEANPDKVVIINTAARANESIEKNAKILVNALPELGRQLVTLWVINRQRDSLNLLNDYMQNVKGETHVVINGYFGEREQFELYENSNIRKTIEGGGGKSIYFPNLVDRVSDELYTKRLTIAGAMKDMPLGNRSALTTWRADVSDAFKEVKL